MAFLEDPRLRQRWNRISQTAENATENAAAGIWSFQHGYVTPCLASLAESLDSCTALCLGDREERARRRRERERARGRAEYSFDFYDDWYDEYDEPGMLAGWSYDDWDRLLVGSGSARRAAGHHHQPEVSDQPRRKRGMSYGTRGGRRKPVGEDDPTVIPSTQPIGFLGKLPWKIGGTLRYKPSAANLQEHPGHHEVDENAPLLGGRGRGRAGRDDHNDDDDDEDDHYFATQAVSPRRRSGTTGSGHTSDSYRSRGDLFLSDGEEDAVPLDDEFTLPPERGADDRSSNKTRSSKGKRPISRTVSRTTVASNHSGPRRRSSESANGSPAAATPSMEDLHFEEERVAREEDGEVERKRVVAAQLALRRGLGKGEGDARREPAMAEVEAVAREASMAEEDFADEAKEARGRGPETVGDGCRASVDVPSSPAEEEFVPARLPMFK